MTLSKDSDIDVGFERAIWIWVDDLDVSNDGVDIPLFLNSFDIFAENNNCYLLNTTGN